MGKGRKDKTPATERLAAAAIDFICIANAVLWAVLGLVAAIVLFSWWPGIADALGVWPALGFMAGGFAFGYHAARVGLGK